MIITKSVTRFARNTLTTLKAVRELKILDIDVFFEKENLHNISSDGELILSLLASYAQEESRSASENCKWRIKKMFQAGRTNNCTMLGYRMKDGKYYIIPEEAEIVKQIFTDYLSGRGKMVIVKRLYNSNTTTRTGGLWRQHSIDRILTNEKYVGDMLLQKTFIQDHLSKKGCINQGELPKYHVQNSHEAIISREMFEQVQKERKRRATAYSFENNTEPTYPFSQIITCEKCGKHYKHRVNHGKPEWICTTYDSLGKSACKSQLIPETILINKAAEVLGLDKFDENIFKIQVSEIRIPDHNKLIFIFRDGSKKEVAWEYPPRSNSWTTEMKKVARRTPKEDKSRKESNF